MADNRLSRYVLTDELYALLKRQILSHTMAAGDKINIDKLARDLGVSNIPIREALFRLASEGLVTVVPFKGMFVAEMNLRDIDEIFEIRIYLEELSVRKASVRISRDRLEQMLDDLEQAKEISMEGGEENALAKMNNDLHGAILSYADNENLRQMVVMLIERIHRYLNLVHYKIEMGAELAEHETIVRALIAGDTEGAVSSMRLHLENAHRRLRANFA